jgi:hypothetical protein
MRKILTVLALLALCAPVAATPRKLLVISVDGLDWRYLRDRDALGMKLPNMHRLLAASQVADGVTGVWPTITWPSHTTMMTGMRPDQHGILANASGPLDLSLNYWSAAKIKVPTLWQCVVSAGRSVGAVNWPVTAMANITWNLPEIYATRNGDSSDLETVDRYGTPGLVAEITRAHPSFGYRWLDDRTRTVATVYLLKTKRPDLMLLHLAESDSEQHEEGPYTPHAKAVLERSDELIGDILKALPEGYDVALVSDHGFEAIDHAANLKVISAADGVTGAMVITGGLVTTTDARVADWLRVQSGKGDIGREVPHDELVRYAPNLGAAVAAFEPAPHVVFTATGAARGKAGNAGTHGFWPTRSDYHSVFLLSGPGVKPGKLGTLEMVTLKDRFASAMELDCR